jgi:hypothetical protein
LTFLYFRAPRYFGQTGGDVLLLNWLREDHGTYIDVGAGHPIQDSNTYGLYRRGWRGILIDPIDVNTALSIRMRKGDRVIKALVGIGDKDVDFWQIEPYIFSTTSEEVAKKIIEVSNARLVRISRMKTITLASLDVQMNPLDPTFLCVDTEGSDLEVLQSNDWTRLIPRVICVEEWSNKNFKKTSAIRDFLLQHNYELVGQTYLSSIFVEKSYLEGSK